MMRTLCALALAALICAGCGSETKTASNSSGRALKFSGCMRDNGVSGFPDPDASGELTLDGVVNGSSLNPDGAAFKHAIAACKDLQPAGFTGTKRTPERQRAALEFAGCVRAHGVKDFPDPAIGAPLIDTNHIPSANEPGGMTILNAATHACSAQAAVAIGSATATAQLTKQQMGLKFAECMRGNGVADFPDPDPKGDFAYGVGVSPEAFTKAVDACKALEPPGALSSKRNPEQESDALRFAECVRSHGVPDFPDPVQGQPLIDTTHIPSSNRPGGMTILNAATNKCGTG